MQRYTIFYTPPNLPVCFCEFWINFYADPLLILYYVSAKTLLKFSFHSRGIAFAERWDNVFTIKFQWKIVKFHIDIRKRQAKILLIAENFVILHRHLEEFAERMTTFIIPYRDCFEPQSISTPRRVAFLFIIVEKLLYNTVQNPYLFAEAQQLI